MSPGSPTPPFALAPVQPDADQVRLEALQVRLVESEAELAALKTDLKHVQARYLDEIGPFYAEFGRLETLVIDAEIGAGLRPPPSEEAGDADVDEPGIPAPSCSNRSASSDDLKKMFRDLAKAIHPDLADDEPARFHRHSLMAEANRAYAERDEDRLRLILRAWEQSAAVPVDDDPDAAGRLDRRIAAIDRRLMAIDVELADLRGSAIWRLKDRIDEARSQGWDLFGEMILQVKSEIARATRRLKALQRVDALP